MSDNRTPLAALSAALKDFARTNRYNFLKALQVGRFLQGEGESIGVVSELTFEKLVELGSPKIAKLRWLTPEQETRLVSLLRALSSAEADSNEVPPLIKPPSSTSRPAHSSASDDTEENMLSSVEVEQRLRQKLQELRSHSNFSSVAGIPLGKFWGDEWPRAPFEEAFTLDQLGTIDLSLLWKKRMMTTKRIDRMAQAVERALQSLTPVPAGSDLSAAVATPKTEQPRLTLVDAAFKATPAPIPTRTWSEHPWMTENLDVPAIIRAGVEQFLGACLASQTTSNQLNALLGTLPEELLMSDFLLLMNPSWSSSEMTPRMSMWVATPEFREATIVLRAALQGPGIHISRVSMLLEGLPFVGSVGEIAALALSKLLGAVEVRFDDQICSDVWTLNPGLTAVLVEHLKLRKGSSVSEALEQVAPSLDVTLKEWILAVTPQKTKRRPRLPRVPRKIVP
jgi:hypothetical protein